MTLTESGLTARLVSKARPNAPILAFSKDDRTLRRLALYWGVSPRTLVTSAANLEEQVQSTSQILSDNGLVKSGERYAEYRPGDKIAKYGLAALVTGGAAVVAVKTGLFAYLLLLQVGLLVVAWRRGWTEIGGLALGGGLLWTFAWLAGPFKPADAVWLSAFLLLSVAAVVGAGLARRTERIGNDGILERFRRVRQPRRNHQDLPTLHVDDLARVSAEPESHASLEHERELLVAVLVGGHQAAPAKEELRHGEVLARDVSALELGAEPLARQVFPAHMRGLGDAHRDPPESWFSP